MHPVITKVVLISDGSEESQAVAEEFRTRGINHLVEDTSGTASTMERPAVSFHERGDRCTLLRGADAVRSGFLNRFVDHFTDLC